MSIQIPEELSSRMNLLGGRGATVLWVALKAIGDRFGLRGEIIIPDLVCPSVLESVLAAGYSPRFAEVDPLTYCMTPETIEPLLTTNTRAIVVVHLFGHSAPMTDIVSLVSNRDIVVIEDAVQGIGGQLESGIPVGASGDFSFVSFHASKMIKGQGAALFYDDEMWTVPLNSALKEIRKTADSESDKLAHTSWRDLYHGLGQAVRLGWLSKPIVASAFRSAIPGFEPLLLRKFDHSTDNVDRIDSSWNTLPVRIKQGNEFAAQIQKSLAHLPIFCPEVKNNSALWRYTIQMPNRAIANKMILAIRQRGGLASQLYYPLHQLYQPELALNSSDLSSRLVNLWLRETRQDYLESIIESAESALCAG